MKKISNIKYNKERVLLSDVLPYETPITFSNRSFYDFLTSNRVEINGDYLSWRSDDTTLDAVICLIFGISKDQKLHIKSEPDKKYFRLTQKNKATIPFNYGISHKEDSLRELSVMHPRNQVLAVSFYEHFKELIIYYCSFSEFSLRAPAAVAKSFYFKRGLSLASVIEGNEYVQQLNKPYKNLRSFFSYKEISNIFKFYESTDYHQAEQKYNKMASLDISKCFDSIYTHSIAWATFGKDQVKDCLVSSGTKFIRNSFPDEFDTLMQQQNYNETNGILIGPELSRIFSEIILQKIDFDVKKNLERSNLVQGRDYKIFRYLDDYFVFFNEDHCYKYIAKTLEKSLKEFKLGLNTEKERIYEKPIITEVTIAKRKISNLITEKMKFEITESKDSNEFITRNGRINIRSKSFITELKSIIKESGVNYKDVVNYSIAIIEKRTLEILKDFKSIHNPKNAYKGFSNSLNAIIDVCFFVYSVSPKVNRTIKLSRVLYSIIRFARTQHVSYDDMHQIFKRIFDHTYFVINKHETDNFTQVETLYLLTVISELGKNYWLEEDTLASYFGAERSAQNSFTFRTELNYFSITVLLFYMKNKKRYTDLKKSLIAFSTQKLKKAKHNINKDTESTLLVLDLVACPYIDSTAKSTMLDQFDVDRSLHNDLILFKKHWFTKWDNFDFGKELDAKVSTEVY